MTKLKYPFSTLAFLLAAAFLLLFIFALNQGIGGGSIGLVHMLEQVIGFVAVMAIFVSVAAIVESFQKPNVLLFLFNLLILSVFFLLIFSVFG